MSGRIRIIFGATAVSNSARSQAAAERIYDDEEGCAVPSSLLAIFCRSYCFNAGYYLLKREKGAWRQVKNNPFCEQVAMVLGGADVAQAL